MLLKAQGALQTAEARRALEVGVTECVRTERRVEGRAEVAAAGLDPCGGKGEQVNATVPAEDLQAVLRVAQRLLKASKGQMRVRVAPQWAPLLLGKL